MGDHDEDHGSRGPPKGAALAGPPLPTLPTLLAKKVLKGHKKRKLNSDKDPIHPAFMKRGQSLPHQPLNAVEGSPEVPHRGHRQRCMDVSERKCKRAKCADGSAYIVPAVTSPLHLWRQRRKGIAALALQRLTD